MGYKRQTFIDKSETEKGTTITAAHMRHIEDGIIQLEATLKNYKTARIGYINLLADKWVGTSSPYSQIVTVNGASENTQVDLTPSVAQLAIFHQKDLAFVTENDGGVVTVYAIGQKPTNDYTIQVTMTEVIA